MMNKEFEIDAYRKGRELLAILRGRLVLSYCPDAKARLTSLIGPQVDRVYLDLDGLGFLDSAGLGVLLGVKMQANKNHTSLIILAPSSRIEDIFRVSKLDTIFEIRPGAEAKVIRDTIAQDDYCLWCDSRDTTQHLSTEGGEHAPFGRAAASLTQFPIPEAENEAELKIKQHCADAVEYIRQGDYPKSIEAYEQALELDPDNLSALNNLGIVFEKRAEWYPRAVSVWERVLKLSTEHGDEKHAARARKHMDSLAKIIKIS